MANQLQYASSPYLQQHADNPVHWFEWGPEALETARREDKLLLISVGYAACHWCHVMAHQSFEDPGVASLMNTHLVNIKVDREERPDIDQIYMTAAQLSTGQGGWPLNVFALPDGRPFYGATYFTKDQWIQVVRHMANMFRTKRRELEEAATAISEGVQRADSISVPVKQTNLKPELIQVAFETWLPHMDLEKGGEKGKHQQAPKFPMPATHEFLLNFVHFYPDESVRRILDTNLTRMAMGGIYDHVEGGFARYSTDQDWIIPHFEKMLYDNAQMVQLYSKAYRATENTTYRQVVYETTSWLESSLKNTKGAFYSSLDADSEGVEGKYYVYTPVEFRTAAENDFDLLASVFDYSSKGNFEGSIHLYQIASHDEVASGHGISVDLLNNKLAGFKDRLKTIRSTRTRPGLDDKIVTSWNAMMISGFCHAYRSFTDPHFLDLATACLHHFEQLSMHEDGGIYRIVKDDNSSIRGFLDDYSFMAEAYIDMYTCTFDESYLYKAKSLVEYCLQHFFDARSGMFYYTSDLEETLIARKMELSDNVISSSNSSLAKALFYLGHYLSNDEYLTTSRQMLQNILEDLKGNLRFYSNWGSLLLYFLHIPSEVAILGKDWKEYLQKLDQQYLPGMLPMGGETEGSLPLLAQKLREGQTTIYVCREKVCQAPTTEVEGALVQISQR